MTLSTPPPARGLNILKTSLYFLAGLVLMLGLIGGVSLLTSANYMVGNFLLPFQVMGLGQIVDSFAPMFTGVFINLGVVAIVITLVLSALLYTSGRLVGRIAELEVRLAWLESRTS